MTQRALIEHALRAASIPFTQFSAIHLDRSAGNSRMMSMLVFVDGRKEPQVYVKTAPAEQTPAGFRIEYDNLSALAGSGNELLLRSVPAPLHIGEYAGLQLLVESVLPGVRLKNLPPLQYLHSPRMLSHLRQIVEWLLAFRTALGESPVVLTADRFERRVATPIRIFREAYRVSPGLDRLFDETAEQLREGEIPFTPWHGDFCTANVLADERDRIGVIDWEHPIERGWPMADLLHFFSSLWCIQPSRATADRKDNYLRIFFQPGVLSRALRDSVARYTGELGIKAEMLLSISVMAWVEYANRKAECLARIGARDDESAGRHLPLVLVHEGHCLNLELLVEHRDEYVLNELLGNVAEQPGPNRGRHGEG